MFTKHAVRFAKGKKTIEIIETKNECQTSLICLAGRTGYRGVVRVPVETKECKRVLESYQDFIDDRNSRLWELVEERTADEDMQDKIFESLVILLRG